MALATGARAEGEAEAVKRPGSVRGQALDAAPGRPTGARVLAHTAACVLAVVAICFIAAHRHRLIDLIATTVRFGPDA